jgi:hypothetical protein
VTLYKGHLGVGVTEPSGQLELAGDERIQEYPPRAMTKNETLVEGHGVFSALGGIGGETYAPWKAFDKSTSTFWIDVGIRYSDVTPFGALSTASKTTLYDGSVLSGGWIDLECPYPVKLKRVGTAPRTNYPSIGLQRGIILGSNNGVDWYQIDTIDYAGTTPPNTLTYFDITTETYYSHLRLVCTNLTARYPASGTSDMHWQMGELVYFGTPGPTTLDKGSLSLTRSLDVPRVSRYDVDTETPRPEKLVVDFDTTVNSTPTDISGEGNHGAFYNGASYSPADKAFKWDSSTGGRRIEVIGVPTATGAGNFLMSVSMWFKLKTTGAVLWGMVGDDDGTDGSPTNYSAPHAVVNSAGNITWAMWGNDLTNQTAVVVNRWYHCVWTYSGGTTGRKMFLDGVEQTFNIAQTHALNMVNATSRLVIGIYPHDLATYPLNGYVSNFKLYNVALEPSEVKKLYNLGRTGRSMVISDTAVGIGKVPEAQLDVRGNLKVSGGIYTGMNYAVFVWLNGFATLSAGNKIPFDTAVYNPLGLWNTSTYQYTCPVNGVYMCTATLLTGDNSYNANHEWYLNDSSYSPRLRGHGSSSATSYKDASSSVILLLNRGDRLDVRNASAGEWYGSTGYTHTSANIHLLYPI